MGYAEIAKITAKAIADTLDIKTLKRVDNSGVQVVNLMGNNGMTDCKITPGWYSLSFKADTDNGKVKLHGQNQDLETPFNLEIPVKTGEKRICKRFFTEAAGYGYTPDQLILEAENCTVSEVLLEKIRPSRQASIYNNRKSYIDAVSPFNNGELLEYKK